MVQGLQGTKLLAEAESAVPRPWGMASVPLVSLMGDGVSAAGFAAQGGSAAAEHGGFGHGGSGAGAAGGHGDTRSGCDQCVRELWGRDASACP